MASFWEIAIKRGQSKLRLATAKLPLLHRDPFDRMLAAQAIEKDLPIISADAVFESYGVQRIW